MVIRDPNCTRCPLFRGAKTVCVGGSGEASSGLMLVGEAPGEEEDQAGRPFIGKAGKLLDSILEQFGLSRTTVYVTNSVKCRPPKNRTPHTDEITACHTYLERELASQKPKLVLGLGVAAMCALLEQKKYVLGANRGATFFVSGIPVIGTYHPAAILREPSRLQSVIEDFEKAMLVLERGVTKKEPAKYFKGVAKLARL